MNYSSSSSSSSSSSTTTTTTTNNNNNNITEIMCQSVIETTLSPTKPFT